MKDDAMSVLANNKRQLTLIYNSQSSLGKQTLGYVESADDKIQAVDISKTKLGDTVWVSIADGLNKPLEALLDTDIPDVPDVKTSDFDTDDWLKLLKKNPALLQKPIAINGQKYLQITTPSEALKFFEVDSAGLKKNRLGQEPTISSRSGEDTFI